MSFFTMLLQSPAVVDIRSRADEISPISEFAPTVEGLIRGLFFVAALLTFFYLLWGAFDWVLSQGDSGKVEAARKKITHAVIGLAVFASVGALFLLLQSFLGIEFLSGRGGSKSSSNPEPCIVGRPCRDVD
jgi:bacteriorhodopsin